MFNILKNVLYLSMNSRQVITSLNFQPFQLKPQIFSIVVVLAILLIAFIVYYVKLKKIQPNKAPSGYVLTIQVYVSYIRGLVVDILGPEFEKITPYFLYLSSYILLSNIIGIFGLTDPTTSLTVTLSMGFVMFIGCFVIGFKYQKLSWLKKFTYCIKVKGKQIPIMINPFEISSQITPLISISFRLWGNIFAGSLIIGLWFYFTAYISKSIPIIGMFNLLGGLSSVPLHMYFDLLCGIVQTLVFTLLTIIYWTLEKGFSHEENLKKVNKVAVVNNIKAR